MKKGTLTNGFKFSVNEKSLDDMELLEAMAEADAGNALKFTVVIEKLLGKQQKLAFYDSLRDKKTGVVPITKVSDALVELIEKIGQEEDEGKNS